LLDLLEAGDCAGAADFLRRHLEAVRAVKATVLRSAPHAPAARSRGQQAVSPATAKNHIHF
jgi:DNA-binding GntR family transcriptional regulator